jgi:hypothetical protein
MPTATSDEGRRPWSQRANLPWASSFVEEEVSSLTYQLGEDTLHDACARRTRAGRGEQE